MAADFRAPSGLRRIGHARAFAAVRIAACLLGLGGAPAARALDAAALWDFDRPEVSEQRFRAALASATGDDALVLQTQIARTYGLRKDFAKARALLHSLEPAITAAGPEARARYFLELGRTFASAAHTEAMVTPEAREEARAAFTRALDVARKARLDALAVDAIHMFAFVDTAPADQLEWDRQALAVALASEQPDAKRWEASIRNNVGYALHQLGRYDEALAQFEAALRLREAGGNASATRVARWMVAWTLHALKRNEEALAIQLRLEHEGDAAGDPDPYVFEELETLYRERGDAQRAAHYAVRLAKARARGR